MSDAHDSEIAQAIQDLYSAVGATVDIRTWQVTKALLQQEYERAIEDCINELSLMKWEDADRLAGRLAALKAKEENHATRD